MLLYLILFIGIFGFAAIVISAILLGQRSKAPNGSDSWPTTEATVQGSEMRPNGRYDQLPSFIFSYAVGEEYYSGWFALSAHADRADTLLKEMINKKVIVRYDPNQPSKFYVSGNAVEGCEVKDQGEV